jgi:eukaryotic-like serine/threonine-protein kinase
MPSLHERAKDLFLAALDRPAAERPRFVAESCGEDTALRVEVESLLEFHEDNGGAAVAAAPVDEPFKAGAVFSGRYRMITRIGRGGMGDVWRADDLVLETPVALKLIHSASAEARQQILNEVRLARPISHPAVCRVFDVGETDGHVFFTMALVQGEDLSTLLKRVGRLSSEKVIDIARQLCDGLAAAHAEGVLHRDLKPANVLIDDDGRVQITDFGIAVPRDNAAPHAIVGTPAYMAPEQLVQGGVLTERTDLYALALILYELVVGQRAFTQITRNKLPTRPSSRVAGVNTQLERVILEALEPDPQLRPASAAQMAAELPVDNKTEWSKPWLFAAALVVVAALAGVGWSFVSLAGPRPLTEQDTIVLSDFTNTTGDPVFDGALKVALAVALEQSPFLRVFPDERIRETLRLMGRPPDTPLTRSVAREVAEREQLKALLTGSIAGLGRNFVVTLEAVGAASGEVMAREQIEATSKEDVLTSLGTAASRLREKLGESLASVQKFDVPLARATTSSLDALQAYSRALDNGRINPRLEAIPHLRRAIDLDANFALAHALLATIYANTGQTSLAPEFARKAFDLRDRVSERERYFIAFRYYRDAVQDWNAALELSRTWTSTYPREAFAFNSLGASLARFGQFEQAVAPMREAMRLDAKLEPPYANLVGVLMALGRFDEARIVLREGRAQGIGPSPFRRMSYRLAFYDGDVATTNRMLEASIGVGQTNAAHGWQAHSDAFSGEVRRAHEQFRRGIQLAVQNGFTEVAGQLAVEDAEVHAMVGQCDIARNEINGGLLLSRDNFAVERASRTLAWCGAEAEAGAAIRDLESRYGEATFTMGVAVPLTRAAIAYRKHESQRAIDLLAPLTAFDRAPISEFWTEYVRGLSYLQLKDGKAAAAQFQSLIAHRGEYTNSPLYSLAHLGLARASALAGDVAAAKQAYLDFLRLWKNADDDLEPLISARLEYSQLP